MFGLVCMLWACRSHAQHNEYGSTRGHAPRELSSPRPARHTPTAASKSTHPAAHGPRCRCHPWMCIQIVTVTCLWPFERQVGGRAAGVANDVRLASRQRSDTQAPAPVSGAPMLRTHVVRCSTASSSRMNCCSCVDVYSCSNKRNGRVGSKVRAAQPQVGQRQQQSLTSSKDPELTICLVTNKQYDG
jgi:hypothetical protein